MSVLYLIPSIYFSFSDRQAEKELDVNDSEMTSTVQDTWFINIAEDEIKLEYTEIQGKLVNLDKHMTMILQRYWWEFWSCETDVSIISIKK